MMQRILTIAGSDSGGGAGIQADLKAITVLGEYGMSVLTALTAQNTVGVQGIQEVAPEFIRLQLEAVIDDIGADAAKTGMLASAEIVATVAAGLRGHRVAKLVVDPVMVAASGDRLLSEDAIATVKEELLPLATVATPNLAEAAILCGFPVNDIASMQAAAESIASLGAEAVLVKGGHLPDRAVDVLFDGRRIQLFDAARIAGNNTHGSGCTLSAALAVFLARGMTVDRAVAAAKAFISRAIGAAVAIGNGHGPTNPYAHVARSIAKDAVLGELQSALDTLLLQPLGFLIPEIRSNFGYALPQATDRGDVAAIRGRITNVGERLAVSSGPAFGASRHIAKVILAAMRSFPELRSAIAIRHDPAILQACDELGMLLVEFDRADEPEAVQATEGMSLEWGTAAALSRIDRAPDAVHDRGGMGKEPVIRLLGRNPADVLRKITAIAERYRKKSAAGTV